MPLENTKCARGELACSLDEGCAWVAYSDSGRGYNEQGYQWYQESRQLGVVCSLHASQ